MAIRLTQPSGPEPMPELSALLKDKNVSIDGDAVLCPHCFRYLSLVKPKNGPTTCTECRKVFFLLKRGRFTFLTSKTEIPNVQARQ